MKKFNIIIILLVALFFICACGGNGGNDGNGENDWDSKVIENVEAVQETFEKEYEYDEFNLDLLKLKVSYTDGTSREIGVTDLMLSDKDIEKTKKTGNPRITIEYDGFIITTTIKLIDSAILDEDLNKEGKYAAVIKAIRNENSIDFILESYDAITGITFAYTFDNNIMQLGEGKLNASLKGVGKVIVEDGKISFAYADANPITEETVLFSVDYTGDFRNSKLGVDLEFSNVVYVVDLETYMTKEVINVLYHASIK